MAVQPPFGPNAALRQFNSYFSNLRKQYGDAGLRKMGFTPRDLSKLQASLRSLQMNNAATPEQHSAALREAMASVGQRLTAARPISEMPQQPPMPQRPAPPPQQQPQMPPLASAPIPQFPPGLRDLPRSMPVPDNFASAPVAERIAMHRDLVAAANPAGSSPQMSPGMRNMGGVVGELMRQPQPQAPMPQAPMSPGMQMPQLPPLAPTPTPQVPMLQPGGGLVDNGSDPNFGNPMMPTTPPPQMSPGMRNMGGMVGELLRQPQPQAPMLQPGGGIGGLLPPQQPQAQTPFDRNASRRAFDAEFRSLREKYGADGLRTAGFTPRTLAGLQSGLTNLQMDNNSTQEQHNAALQTALQQLRGYNFAGPQPVAPPIPPQGG